MKLTITCILALSLIVLAGSAMAVQTAGYGWEDGVGTDLGTYGNVGIHENVADFAHTGTHSLYMTEDPIGSTPQVYVAWVAGLQDLDEITVSFWSYDDTPGASPSSRIWGHYTNNDVTSYEGSASGGTTYTAGTGWEQQSWTWTFDGAGHPAATGIMVEFRLYSGTVGQDYYWCDDVEVSAPDHALIFFADNYPTVPTEPTTWGGVKSLYK